MQFRNSSDLFNALVTSGEDEAFHEDLRRVGAHACIQFLDKGLEMVQQGAEEGHGLNALKIIQELAWEKLHTGPWAEVDVAWRDAYSLACLLRSILSLSRHASHALSLPGSTETQLNTANGITRQDSNDTAQPRRGPGAAQQGRDDVGECSERDAIAIRAAVMKDLDMAVIMGGPRFRPWVDALLDLVQEQHMQLDRAGARGAGHSLQAGGSFGCEDDEKRHKRQQPAGRSSSSDGVKRMKMTATHEVVQVEATSKGQGSGSKRQEQLVESSMLSWPKLDLSQQLLSLPEGSLEEGSVLPTEDLPSLERFLLQYMANGQPAIITGAMEHWPAMSKWQQPQYFLNVAGLRTVPVEVGQHYLAEQWGQALMPLSDFIIQHMLHEHVSNHTGPERCSEGSDGDRGSYRRGYLAQHPLFEQIPALARDIAQPEYCNLGEGIVHSVNAWFGPTGTVTPLHCDPHHNLLAQAVGVKYVRLYSPNAAPQLYPYESGLTTNSSQVDLDAPDHAKYPEFKSTPYMDCLLRPGQMLYIPPKWWHYVRSLSSSFSVSFWWT